LNNRSLIPDPRALFRVTVATLATTLLLSGVASAQSKAIRFGKLWDGSKVITDAVVVVSADRIMSVGSGDRAVPAGAQVVDLRNYFGLPGLIDLHTHITYYWDRKPGTRPRGTPRLPAVTVYLAQDNARRTLESGVTTVRDLNAGNDMDLAMRELIASGAMIGPRMFVSAPACRLAPINH
jgi:imidazolonepropionase-like amidohydrolase